MIIREATRTGGGYRYRIEIPGMYVDADGHPLPGERFVDVSEAAVLGANGDPDALAAAIDDLLGRKPHLASRRPLGDIGQGARGNGTEPVGLLSILKGLT